MRRLLIDTDTGSDDAVALIAALRDPAVHVEAITVVAGNVSLDLAVRNALISVEMANTYAPPVYRGLEKPLLRTPVTAEIVHGDDGLGDLNLPDPTLSTTDGHAVDIIIETIQAFPGELEIVTLGPLTNLALACLREPSIVQQVKSLFVMGGGTGNITPSAEFNLYGDAEAAQIVLNSGLNPTFVIWDASTDETFIDANELDMLRTSGSKIADFCVRCNDTLKAFNEEYWGKSGIDLPDPVTMIAALYPDIITEQVAAFCAIEHKSPDTYGQLVIDHMNLLRRPPNATVVSKVEAVRFKELLFARIQ